MLKLQRFQTAIVGLIEYKAALRYQFFIEVICCQLLVQPTHFISSWHPGGKMYDFTDAKLYPPLLWR